MAQWLVSHRWLGIMVVALVALVAFVACGDDEEEKATASPGGTSPAATVAPQGPLKIGLLLDFTGALASFGPEEEKAAKLAIKHINAAGGVLGKPVEAVTGDSQTSPQAGVAEARRLIDIEKVHAIVGSLGSSVTAAVAESVTVPAKIPQISHASTSPALTKVADNDFLFRVPISDAAQGIVLANLVYEDLGYKKVCAMYVNNAYGQGLEESFEKAYEAAGGTVTAAVSHADQTAATTYVSELNQCVKDDPEALVAISYPVGQGQVYLKEAIEQSLIDKFVFVDGTKDDEMFTALGWSTFDGMKGTSPGSLPPEDFSKKFDEAYLAEYGSLYKVPFTKEAYDAVIAIALAAEKAKSTDGTKIRDALRDIGNAPGVAVGSPPAGIKAALEAVRAGTDIDYQGAGGSVEWDENGDVLLGAIDVWHVDAAGQTFVTDKTFKVDLEAATVEEITAANLDFSTVDRVARLDPVLLRALKSLT